MAPPAVNPSVFEELILLTENTYYTGSIEEDVKPDAWVSGSTEAKKTPQQDSRYGTAFATLCVCCLSYASIVAFFHTKPTFYGWLELYPEDKAAVLHEAVFVPTVACCGAFGAALTLNLITMVAQVGTSRQDASAYASAINSVALMCFVAHATGFETTYVSTWQRPVSIIRMAMWLHTTPCMLCMLFAMTNLERHHLVRYLAADIFMIMVGLPTMFARSTAVNAAATVAAMAAFVYVISAIYCMMSQAIHETSRFLKHGATGLLFVLEWTSLFLWSAFPAIHLASICGWLSFEQEWQVWLAADATTKIIYNGALLYCSVMSARKRAVIHAHLARMGERDKMISDLEALLENRNSMISLVSHEVRTPLHGIIGLASSLVRHSELRPADRQTVQLIRSSGLRLLNLINDVLDSFTLEYSNLVVSPVKMNLQKEVLDCVSTVLPLVKRAVVVHSTVSRSMPPVFADPMRFTQIMLNLLGNAIRFTSRGSIVIAADVPPGSSLVTVSVTDTGVGIKQENLKKIFDTWCTGDEQTTRKYGGTGLGLSLVRQLVESHGGEVWVRSKLNKGSTFCFTLPLYSEAVHVADDDRMKEPSAHASVSSHGAKLPLEHGADGGPTEARLPLVVCGEADSDQAAQLATLTQYTVVTHTTGSSLVQYLKSSNLVPDCIILDCDLPCGDDSLAGLCQLVRADYADCPIIMTHAGAADEGPSMALCSVAAEVLTKPYTAADLDRHLRTLLPRGASPAPPADSSGATDTAAGTVSAARSSWVGDMERALRRGGRYECAAAVVMVVCIHDVDGLVEALGLDRVAVLVRTLYSQCISLSRSEDIFLYGSLSPSIVIVGNPDAKSAGTDVLLCGKKLLQWVDTINESLSQSATVTISAAAHCGRLQFELDTLSDAKDGDRVVLLGPAMHDLRQLRRQAVPACISVSPNLQGSLQAADPKNLGLQQSVGAAGQVLYHLGSSAQQADSGDDSSDSSNVFVDLQKQVLSEEQLAMLALILATPVKMLQRVVTETRLSFTQQAIKRDLQAARDVPPPSSPSAELDAVKAQLQLTTDQCVSLYKQVFALSFVAEEAGILPSPDVMPSRGPPGAVPHEGLASASAVPPAAVALPPSADAQRGRHSHGRGESDEGVRAAVEMLRQLGLPHMCAAFEAEHISADIVPYLSREQLVELGARTQSDVDAVMSHVFAGASGP